MSYLDSKSLLIWYLGVPQARVQCCINFCCTVLYTHTNTHIRMYTCTHTNSYIHTCTCMQTQTCVCTHVCTHTHIHTHVYTFTYTHSHTHTFALTQNKKSKAYSNHAKHSYFLPVNQHWDASAPLRHSSLAQTNPSGAGLVTHRRTVQVSQIEVIEPKVLPWPHTAKQDKAFTSLTHAHTHARMYACTHTHTLTHARTHSRTHTNTHSNSHIPTTTHRHTCLTTHTLTNLPSHGNNWLVINKPYFDC